MSRLDPNHYRQYHGLPPELSYKDLRMRRKLFAKYGMKSEEDPRLMWPTRTEMLEAEQEEMEERLSLQERLQAIQSKKELAEKERLARSVYIHHLKTSARSCRFTLLDKLTFVVHT